MCLGEKNIAGYRWVRERPKLLWEAQNIELVHILFTLGKLGPKKFSCVQLNLGQELSRHNSHPPPDLPCLRHYRTYAIHLQEKCLEQQVLSRSVEQVCIWVMMIS